MKVDNQQDVDGGAEADGRLVARRVEIWRNSAQDPVVELPGGDIVCGPESAHGDFGLANEAFGKSGVLGSLGNEHPGRGSRESSNDSWFGSGGFRIYWHLQFVLPFPAPQRTVRMGIEANWGLQCFDTSLILAWV